MNFSNSNLSKSNFSKSKMQNVNFSDYIPFKCKFNPTKIKFFPRQLKTKNNDLVCISTKAGLLYIYDLMYPEKCSLYSI